MQMNGTPHDVLTLPGWHVEIEPLLFTHRIIVTDGVDVEFLWCYHTREAALEAAVRWRASGYVGEPQGWHRAKRSGQPFRRRPNGKAESEYSDSDPPAKQYEMRRKFEIEQGDPVATPLSIHDVAP